MRYGLLVFWMITATLSARGQTPFTVTWSFENNIGATSTNGAVSGNNPVPVGVNIPGIASIAYIAGASGEAVGYQNWATSGCYAEYVEFTISPGSNNRLSISSLSFYFARSSSSAPTQLYVRSSVDGFTNNLGSYSPATGFQAAVIAVSGGGFTNLTAAVSFRIYACGATSGGTIIRLDEVQINGTVTTTLPVELLYFRAQPQGNTVGLSWATTWERNAGKFTIQRSRDLSEFLTIGEMPATGNTDSRQTYGFTDQWPDAGTTYYRLLQTDRDGTTQYAKPVAVTLDDDTPTLALLENPANADNIAVATRNLAGAAFRLISLTGQSMTLLVENQANNATVLRTNGIVSAGLYWLQATSANGKTVGSRVLIR